MTLEEKIRRFSPKQWAMYCNNQLVNIFGSHNAAKRALHHKCKLMKGYPYDYCDEYYTIKPYGNDTGR